MNIFVNSVRYANANNDLDDGKIWKKWKKLLQKKICIKKVIVTIRSRLWKKEEHNIIDGIRHLPCVEDVEFEGNFDILVLSRFFGESLSLSRITLSIDKLFGNREDGYSLERSFVNHATFNEVSGDLSRIVRAGNRHGGEHDNNLGMGWSLLVAILQAPKLEHVNFEDDLFCLPEVVMRALNTNVRYFRKLVIHGYEREGVSQIRCIADNEAFSLQKLKILWRGVPEAVTTQITNFLNTNKSTIDELEISIPVLHKDNTKKVSSNTVQFVKALMTNDVNNINRIKIIVTECIDILGSDSSSFGTLDTNTDVLMEAFFQATTINHRIKAFDFFPGRYAFEFPFIVDREDSIEKLRRLCRVNQYRQEWKEFISDFQYKDDAYFFLEKLGRDIPTFHYLASQNIPLVGKDGIVRFYDSCGGKEGSDHPPSKRRRRR